MNAKGKVPLVLHQRQQPPQLLVLLRVPTRKRGQRQLQIIVVQLFVIIVLRVAPVQ